MSRDHDDDISADDFEREAAAVHLAHGGKADAELPARLAARLEASAARFIESDARSAPSVRPDAVRAIAATTTAAGAQVVVVEMPEKERRFDAVRWAGWLAAAACLVLGLGREVASPRAGSPARGGTASVASVASVAVAERAPMRAEVSWSDESQSGTLVAHGFAANEVGEEYEVWFAPMSDSDRLPTLPIPVGRFRSSGSGADIEVRLATPIRVTAADRLKITRERAGGALVSNGSPVVLDEPLRAR